ncbi:MAG: hypothetical protein ACK40H_05930, partial [Sphingomonadaceae bacterium]
MAGSGWTRRGVATLLGGGAQVVITLGAVTGLGMLAGLESVTAGTMRIDDQVVEDLPPQDRDGGIVFQDYAVFQT